MLKNLNLRLDRTVILVGAGASVASGIATGQMFNRIMLPRLIPDDLKSDDRTLPLSTPVAARRRPRKGSIRFEQLIEIVRQTADPNLLIMQYLEGTWSPSPLHHWIAQAIHHGSIVLTTNLDSLIEIAYREQFNIPLKQVIERGEHRHYQLGEPCLFKLHGTIRRETYLEGVSSAQPATPFVHLKKRALESFGVTLDAVGSLPSSASGVQGTFLLPDHVLDTLRKILPGRDLLVLGYSGSDDFDITPSFRFLEPLLTRVLWVDHRTNAQPHPRSNGKFHHIQGDTLLTISSLFEGITVGDSLPGFDPRERFTAFCDEWANWIDLSQQKKYLICGSILRSMGYLSNALSVWETGLERVHQGDLASLMHFCNSLGQAYLAEQSYAPALEVYEDVFAGGGSRAATVDSHTAASHSIHATLGYASTLVAAGSILLDEEMQETGLSLLTDFYGISPPGSELSLFEVKAAIFISRIIRNRQSKRFPAILGRMAAGLIPASNLEHLLGSGGLAYRFSNGEFDLGSLLTRYLDWPILEANKVLRAECLKELALWSLLQQDQQQFKIRQQEFFRLCSDLNLVYLRAVYLLELADILGQSDVKAARAAYLQSGEVFLGAGYEVGYAEACMGAAVMGMLDGDTTEARQLLMTSIRAFQNHHCVWNVDQCRLLIRELILLRGEAAEIHSRFGARHPELADLLQMQRHGYKKRAIMKEMKGRFYRTIQTHWRENLGVAGWATAQELHGDSIFENLLLPW